MKKLNHWLSALMFSFFLIGGLNVNAQCTFEGLDPAYCIGDEPSTLTPEVLGGTFSGPGITGAIFNPTDAGPGTHTITYETGGVAGGGSGDAYYMKSSMGNPWGSTTNNGEMDVAFGAGGWTLSAFETADPAVVFSPATGFVFMDGSDGQATELNTFLIANLPAIEAWVFAGGRLILNSAPNEGGDMDFGFDGTTLEYTGGSTLTDMGEVVDITHPAFIGPSTPTDDVMDGNWYGHALIEGVGLTTIIVDLTDASKVVLAEKCWGTGRVMFGGMTTTNWHDPDPHASNWRSNLFTYMYNTGCGEPCTSTQEVTVHELPEVTLTVDDDGICEEESVVFTPGGADTYEFDPAAVNAGIPYSPSDIGATVYTVTGTDLTTGCQNTATVSVTVFEIPDVTATTDDAEVCLGDSFTLTGGGADSYTWDNGAIDGIPNVTTSIGNTVYTVIGTSAEGCVDVAAVTVKVIDCEPVFSGFEYDNDICLGDCITFTDTSIGTTIVTYDWDFGGAVDPNTSNLQNPTICFDSVGVFDISLTITSLHGKVSTSTNTLQVNVIPTVTAELDTIIDLGGEATINAIASTSGIFSWTPDEYVDCPDCPLTTTSPLDSTMYTIDFVDSHGCEAQDQVMVLVNFIEGIGVPTAFSPNGDGFNDILYVKGIGLASINLVLYNRYGEIVFETDDQEVGWDGTYKNRLENPGVFTWVLQYTFVNGKRGMQKGNTTLIN